MRKLISIGESLIDFYQQESGLNRIGFEGCAGGAPANAAKIYAHLGGESFVMTKLGNDVFGDFLLSEMEKSGIKTNYVLRTGTANTSLAFVSLDARGERTFTFYRNNSSDTLLDKSELKKEWFDSCILHFCSVNLVECSAKYAHNKAIEYAKASGGTISFDVNLRFNLWNNHTELKNTVLEYADFADVIKMSEDEAEFLTGENESRAAKIFLEKGAKIVFVTRGKEGACAYTRDYCYETKGFPATPVDTTGAGDVFISTALFALEKGRFFSNPSKNALAVATESACFAASLSVKEKGAYFNKDTFFENYRFV